MAIRVTYLLASAALTAGLLGALTSAEAQTARQQCSAKYQAAKAGNALNGQTFNQFNSACLKELKAEAAAPATAAPATTTAAPIAPVAPAAPATVAVPANPLKPAPTTTAVAPAAPAPVAAGNTVFPSAVSPKYAAEKAYIARRKTCDDQYKINKTTGGNGGLQWTQKGGGYYSECNKRLKS